MVWNDCEEDGCVRRMMVKGMGLLGVNVRKMKALTMQMETMTLIGNSKQNLTCFPWQTWFFFCEGGHLRSESSCIQVNSVYFFHVVTHVGLNQSIIGPLQDKIAGIMQLYVKHMVFTFLSCGISHYRIILTIKL